MPNIEDFGLGSQEAFEQYIASPDSPYLEQHPTARVEKLKRLISEENTDDAEDLMLVIMETLNDTVTPTIVIYSHLDTFSKRSATKDDHPFIACTFHRILFLSKGFCGQMFSLAFFLSHIL